VRQFHASPYVRSSVVDSWPTCHIQRVHVDRRPSIADMRCCGALVLVVAYSLAKIAGTADGGSRWCSRRRHRWRCCRYRGVSSLHHRTPQTSFSSNTCDEESRVDDCGDAQLFVMALFQLGLYIRSPFREPKNRKERLLYRNNTCIHWISSTLVNTGVVPIR